MDFLKKQMGGHKDQKEENPGSKDQGQNVARGEGQAQGQGAGAQKPDYVDKAFDAGLKKTGHEIDPNTREKITDQGREAFEKATGKHIPDKVSN